MSIYICFSREVKTNIKFFQMKEINLFVYQTGELSTQRKKFYVTSKHSVLSIYIYIYTYMSDAMYPNDKMNYEKY